jgi:hypothetical protein
MSNTKLTLKIMKNQSQNTNSQTITINEFSTWFTVAEFKYIAQAAGGIKEIYNNISGSKEYIDNPDYNPEANILTKEGRKFLDVFVPHTNDSMFSDRRICLEVKATSGVWMYAWFKCEMRADGVEIRFDHIWNGGSGKKVRQPKTMIKKLVIKANKMISKEIAALPAVERVDCEIREIENDLAGSERLFDHYAENHPTHWRMEELTKEIAETKSKLAELRAELAAISPKYKTGDRVAFANNGSFEGVIMDSRPSTNMQGDPAPDYLIREDHWSEDYPFAQEWRGECQIIGSVETPDPKPVRSVGDQGESVDVFKMLGSMFDVRGSLDSLNVPKVSDPKNDFYKQFIQK